VLEAWVALGSLAEASSDTVPGFPEKIKRWFPSMIEHRCSIGCQGGFFQRLDTGTWPGHVLEHVTLELQTLVGYNVLFGKVVDTPVKDLYKVVVEYHDEAVAESCLLEAREMLLAAYAHKEYDIESAVLRLKEVANSCALGPSTKAIADAAAARKIPYRRLQNDCSLIQFGQGINQRRIWSAESDCTGAIAEHIAQDKELTRAFLQRAGIPVAIGHVVKTAEDAWITAQDIGLPIVIKPRDGNHGRGVTVNLWTKEQIEISFERASQEGCGVIVEKHIDGDEHRALIIGGQFIAANHGIPAIVIGNGEHTIADLVERQLNASPLRGNSELCPWSPINTENWSPMILQELLVQGYIPESVPKRDQAILISRFAHSSVDVSNRVHPSNKELLGNAAKIVGLDICGIDLVCRDLSIPLEEQGGAIVEVNASPSLLLHMKPTIDKNCPVGEAIMSMIYPPGSFARIPVFAVSGSMGRSRVVTLLSHILQATGKFIATSTGDGMQFGPRFAKRNDGDRIAGSQGVLFHPQTELAVCEVNPMMVLMDGLGFDKCNFAIVLNVAKKDIGTCFIDSLDEIAKVHRCIVDVVLPDGTAILNADDPFVRDMAHHCKGSVIYFSTYDNNSTLISHRENGGKALYIAESSIFMAEGPEVRMLCTLDVIPLLLPEQPNRLEALLGAIGAAWAFGIDDKIIVEGLKTFDTGLKVLGDGGQ